MKIIEITDEKITFDNGTTLTDHHDQDCCENVYADFKQLKDTDVMTHEFNEHLEIEGVENAGFRIDKYFIPCYNEQNGYYSSDLSIIIRKSDVEFRTIDISEFVEDKEY